MLPYVALCKCEATHSEYEDIKRTSLWFCKGTRNWYCGNVVIGIWRLYLCASRCRNASSNYPGETFGEWWMSWVSVTGSVLLVMASARLAALLTSSHQGLNQWPSSPRSITLVLFSLRQSDDLCSLHNIVSMWPSGKIFSENWNYCNSSLFPNLLMCHCK